MPPLPSLAGVRGRRLMRVYASALGYAAGHCHITAAGDWYARQVAGWTGIATGMIVLLVLTVLHVQAERETAIVADQNAFHRAAQFLIDRRARGDTQPPQSVPHS